MNSKLHSRSVSPSEALFPSTIVLLNDLIELLRQNPGLRIFEMEVPRFVKPKPLPLTIW